MPDIGAIYTSAVAKNLRPFFANWDPSQKIELGTYGTLEAKVFHIVGHVRDLGITASSITSEGETNRQFESSGVAEIAMAPRVKAAATAATVCAKATFRFVRQNSVFFNVAGCRYSAIKNQPQLGGEILKLLHTKQPKWKREWAVVTDLVQAGSTTILISKTAGAEAELEAAADVPHVDFADASIKLSARKAKNLGFQLVTKDRLTPIFRLSKVQWRWRELDSEFRPKAAGLGEPERSREEYFGLIE